MRLVYVFLAALLFAGSAVAADCSLTLRGSLQSAEGVRWAASELSKAGKAPDVTVELSSKDLGVGDGYVIEPAGRGILLRGSSQGSVIYGLLDIRDRVRQKQPVPRSLRFTPTLRFRAMADNFPFWAGTSMYGDFWRAFEGFENQPNTWWRDRRNWTKVFREHAERRVNALVFNHPHPYPAVLVYDRFQEAQVYSPEQARRNTDDFAWIIREGRKYGISIYFLTWNIVVPPCFAKAHGVEEFGSQATVVRDYTRYCVKKLFDTHPEMGGLITMGAETPVGCTDWVIDTIVHSMNKCDPKPNLIWWGWCTYPEDSLKVASAYKGRTEVMHYLQYEQYFKPMADPRIGRWSREIGGVKMIAAGGPKSALGCFTWGDPEWARKTVRSLVEDNNGSGLLLETWIAAPWLARESFCRYMWAMDREEGEAEWRSRLAEQYSPSVASDYLNCYKAASAVIPRFLHLVHSQTDHYQPQLGLPLVFYLGMPTMSTYVFEWYEAVDRSGRLTPNMGLTWPNPDWGEKVLSINDYAANVGCGKTQFTSTTPVKIADDIESKSLLAIDLLDRLEKVTSERNAGDYAYSLRMLRMNALWGLQAAWKIRAAVNWALFKEAGRPRSSIAGTADDRAADCARCLERSLEWYRKLSEAASRVYANPIATYVSYLCTPPPWKQNDIWHSYRLIHAHWRDMLPRYERELELVKDQLALGPKLAQPPLPDRFWQEKEARVVASFDFSADDPRLVLDAAVRRSGEHSLVYDSRGVEGEWHTFLRTDPAKLPLEVGKRYQVRFRYRVLHNPNKFSQPFASAVRSEKGTWMRDVGTFPTWGAPAGAVGERVIQIEPKEFDDYHLFILVRGPAAIAIDDLTIAEIALP